MVTDFSQNPLVLAPFRLHAHVEIEKHLRLEEPLEFLARRRAGSAADIDDIAQEVFLRLLRYDRAELVHLIESMTD